jgi:hypothetical protein
MGVKKLKQFKELKQTDQLLQAKFSQEIEQRIKDRFFVKHIPKWQLWLMLHSKRIAKHFNYQVGVVDEDITKLILYREVKGKTKVLAKSF